MYNAVIFHRTFESDNASQAPPLPGVSEIFNQIEEINYKNKKKVNFRRLISLSLSN